MKSPEDGGFEDECGLETRKERVTEKNAIVDGEEKEGRGGEWGAGEARRGQGRRGKARAGEGRRMLV